MANHINPNDLIPSGFTRGKGIMMDKGNPEKIIRTNPRTNTEPGYALQDIKERIVKANTLFDELNSLGIAVPDRSLIETNYKYPGKEAEQRAIFTETERIHGIPLHQLHFENPNDPKIEIVDTFYKSLINYYQTKIQQAMQGECEYLSDISRTKQYVYGRRGYDKKDSIFLTDLDPEYKILNLGILNSEASSKLGGILYDTTILFKDITKFEQQLDGISLTKSKKAIDKLQKAISSLPRATEMQTRADGRKVKEERATEGEERDREEEEGFDQGNVPSIPATTRGEIDTGATLLRGSKQSLDATPGIAAILLNQNRAKDLFKILSEHRSDTYEKQAYSPLPSSYPPISLGNNVFARIDTGSFRRHVLYEVDSEGKVMGSVEIKIPGDMDMKLAVDTEDYDVAEDLSKAPELNGKIQRPLMVLRYENGQYPIYREKINFDDETPFQIVVSEYNLDTHESRKRFDGRESVELGGSNAINVITQIADLLGAIISRGWLPHSEMEHLQNFVFMPDGHGSYQLSLVNDHSAYTRITSSMTERDIEQEIQNAFERIQTKISISGYELSEAGKYRIYNEYKDMPFMKASRVFKEAARRTQNEVLLKKKSGQLPDAQVDRTSQQEPRTSLESPNAPASVVIDQTAQDFKDASDGVAGRAREHVAEDATVGAARGDHNVSVNADDSAPITGAVDSRINAGIGEGSVRESPGSAPVLVGRRNDRPQAQVNNTESPSPSPIINEEKSGDGEKANDEQIIEEEMKRELNKLILYKKRRMSKTPSLGEISRGRSTPEEQQAEEGERKEKEERVTGGESDEGEESVAGGEGGREEEGGEIKEEEKSEDGEEESGGAESEGEMEGGSDGGKDKRGKGEQHLERLLRQQHQRALHSEKAKQAADKLQGLSGVGDAEDIYKGIKQIIRVIKLVTGGAGSVGELFASAPSFFLIAHAEWIYSKLNPKYKLAGWEKILVVIADFFIISIFLFAIILFSIVAFFVQHPWETVKNFGFGTLQALWDALH